jgi:hypothetical protein
VRRGDGRRTGAAELVRSREPAFICLHELAGVGKSALVCALVERLEAADIEIVSLDCRTIEPTERGLRAALDAAGFEARPESALDYRFPEPDRTWILEKNDPAALEAAWLSAMGEGAISQDLGKWQVPCLICAGASRRDARRR